MLGNLWGWRKVSLEEEGCLGWVLKDRYDFPLEEREDVPGTGNRTCVHEECQELGATEGVSTQGERTVEPGHTTLDTKARVGGLPCSPCGAQGWRAGL